MPDILKYRPREFWQWVNKAPHTPPNITADQFAAHCSALYTDRDAAPAATSQPTPLDASQMPPVTAEELEEVLTKHFKGGVSSGLSVLPSQVVKHIRGKALVRLTKFVSLMALSNCPPICLK